MKPVTKFNQVNIPSLFREFANDPVNLNLLEGENLTDNFRDFVTDRVKPRT